MNREHEEATVEKEVTIEKWVNLKDIAEHLSVSQDTVRTWIKEGKLPFDKAGKSYKFKISEVDDWVRSGGAAETVEEKKED